MRRTLRIGTWLVQVIGTYFIQCIFPLLFAYEICDGQFSVKICTSLLNVAVFQCATRFEYIQPLFHYFLKDVVS